MPGPGAFLFGKEEIDAALEVLQKGYLFQYGSDDDPELLISLESPILSG
jgi:hypothetical protein